jgi:iron uptake system EfeUOB component EfeO/EfeM
MFKALALCLLLALLAACSKQSPPCHCCPACGPAIPIVNVGVTDEACEPMQLTVKRGKTQF